MWILSAHYVKLLLKEYTEHSESRWTEAPSVVWVSCLCLVLQKFYRAVIVTGQNSHEEKKGKRKKKTLQTERIYLTRGTVTVFWLNRDEEQTLLHPRTTVQAWISLFV